MVVTRAARVFLALMTGCLGTGPANAMGTGTRSLVSLTRFVRPGTAVEPPFDSANLLGSLVSVSGPTVTMGEPFAGAYRGAAALFTYTAKGWQHSGQLEGQAAHGTFGYSVAMSGPTVVVGAMSQDHGVGGAYVFTKDSRTWGMPQELNGSASSMGSNFGESVATDGSTVVVGAPSLGVTGAAYVFAKTAGGWRQTAELKGADPIGEGLDGFGYSVALFGRVAVIGSYNDDDGAGFVYVFVLTDGDWREVARLKASNGQPGDSFGYSVAIAEDIIVVGAPQHGFTGAAYVFSDGAHGWQQAAEVVGSDTRMDDWFGGSVAISGGTIVVGADEHADDSGRAYVFNNTGRRWK